MKRRDLLKASAVTLGVAVVNQKPWAATVTVDPKSKFIIFVNTNVMNAESYANYIQPMHGELAGRVTLIPVNVPAGQTFDDVVRAYKSGFVTAT